MNTNNRKAGIKITALILAAMMVIGLLTAISVRTVIHVAEISSSAQRPRAQDNFFEYVNYNWFQSAVIPDDKMSVGGFDDLETRVSKNLMAELEAMSKKNVDQEYGTQAEMIKMYKLASNFDRLNAEGAEPIQGQLKTIKNLKDLKDFTLKAPVFYLESYALPFSVEVETDLIDATKNSVCLQPADTILPGKEYYAAGNAASEELLEVFADTLCNVLQLMGESPEDAKKITKDTIAFDALLAKYMKTTEESSDYTSMYHPIPVNQVAVYSENIDLMAIVNSLLPGNAKEVVVTNVEYFQHLDESINAGNFDMMKNWMTGMTAYGASSYFSDEIRDAAAPYALAMTGAAALHDRREEAYAITDSLFGFALGEVYVDRYFSAAAKADVETMAANMIDVYKGRLQANDWLSDTTKNKALKKLETMEVHVGYPEELPAYYTDLKVNTSLSLYQNIIDLNRMIMQSNLSGYGKAADRNSWDMTPQTVNAYYNPMTNSIVFPAAILQAPFYDVKQSGSQNYGGIGTVIAHEISHAFDNNGSRFDELGNMANWWTEEDFAEFNKRTKAMENLFDGINIYGGTLNGKQTLGENIADAGGLRCALEAAKALPDADLEAFFINYAAIWAQKSCPVHEEMLLLEDNHAPGQLRVNVQVANIQEFYNIFGVTSSDKMYLAPAKRVSIW